MKTANRCRLQALEGIDVKLWKLHVYTFRKVYTYV